jgi:hypothetical protein
VSPLKSTELSETPSSTRPQRKPGPDLYTVLLVLALIAIRVGMLFLYLEMGLYEFKFKGGPPVAMVTSQTPATRNQGEGIRGQAVAIRSQRSVLGLALAFQSPASAQHSAFHCPLPPVL